MSGDSGGPSPASARGWVLTLTAVASVMAALDTLVVSTALGAIRDDLGSSVEELEWTVNAYNLSFAVLLPTAAAFGDRFGRRLMFGTGLAGFVLASAACALSRDVPTLVAARAVQGIGAALVITLALALVGAAFPAERRGMAIGVLQGVTGLGVGCGPLVGGAIADGPSWEWIFWLNVPIGLLALPLVFTRLPESYGPRTTLDLPGVALVSGGAFGSVWGLVRGNTVGWGSPEVICAFVAGAVLTIGFVRWELRSPAPMVPMRLFRSRTFSAGNAVGFFMTASLFIGVFFFAQFLQNTLGYGPLDAGLRLLPWTGTLFVCAPIAGALADRVGERPLLTAGLLLQAIGMGWLALLAQAGPSYGAMIAPLAVAGCGISMAIPTVQSSVVGAVDRAEIGTAAGINGMTRQLGGVFGIAVAVAIFAGAGSYASPAAFADGFVPVAALGAGLSLAGAAIGLLLPARRPTTPPAGSPGTPTRTETASVR
ncbi:MFS transporter [Embleya sp. NPDC001921]